MTRSIAGMVLLVVAGCADPALVDGFRQRDRDVAAVFVHVADEMDAGKLKAGPGAVKAVNDGLQRITEPPVLAERVGATEDGDGLRAVARARIAASGGIKGASVLALMVAALIAGVLAERFRNGRGR